jgi:hypothetical protein
MANAKYESKKAFRLREFDLRERAEIVSIAQKCMRNMAAQPLIDYFNKAYLTKFENNGTTIADSIINKYYPDCNKTMRENLLSIMLEYTFSFEHCMELAPNGEITETEISHMKKDVIQEFQDFWCHALIESGESKMLELCAEWLRKNKIENI